MYFCLTLDLVLQLQICFSVILDESSLTCQICPVRERRSAFCFTIVNVLTETATKTSTIEMQCINQSQNKTFLFMQCELIVS